MPWCSTLKTTIPLGSCLIALLSISNVCVASTPAIAGKVPYLIALVALLDARVIVVKMALGALGQMSPIGFLLTSPHIVDLGDILPLEGFVVCDHVVSDESPALSSINQLLLRRNSTDCTCQPSLFVATNLYISGLALETISVCWNIVPLNYRMAIDRLRELVYFSYVSYLPSMEILTHAKYPAAVVVSDVHGAGTRVHIPAHGVSKAHNGPPNTIISHEPKSFRKHRPPPPFMSTVAHGESIR
ncbi:hypothetical protein Tco_0033917 [Tanacetum coccineum]